MLSCEWDLKVQYQRQMKSPVNKESSFSRLGGAANWKALRERSIGSQQHAELTNLEVS